MPILHQKRVTKMILSSIADFKNHKIYLKINNKEKHENIQNHA